MDADFICIKFYFKLISVPPPPIFHCPPLPPSPFQNPGAATVYTAVDKKYYITHTKIVP